MATDKQPSSDLTVKYIGDDNTVAERTLFMSFGLLNNLLRLVPNVVAVLASDMDPNTIDAILDEVFAPRDARGRSTTSGYTHPNITMETADAILSWVKEHVLSFFVRRLLHSKGMAEANAEILGLVSTPSSPTGSPA